MPTDDLQTDPAKECLAAVWMHLASFSAPRFQVYRDGSDAQSLARYLWNFQVSAALLPSLIHAEMLLRNSIDREMTRIYGSGWLPRPPFELDNREVLAIERAQEDANRKERDRGRESTRNDLIVELGFSFWVHLLNKEYARDIWNRILYKAFPELPPALPEKRKTVRGAFATARDLRNRVCHGERLIHLPSLQDDHRRILESIRWMSAPIYQAVRCGDRFPETWSSGLHRCQSELDQVAAIATAKLPVEQGA